MNMDFISKIEKTLRKVKHIQELIRKVQNDISKHNSKAIEADLKELTKVIIQVNQDFGIYVSKPSIEKEIDRDFEQMSLELYALCSKIFAAIKMGRDDIASNYLESLTSGLSPYFRDWFEPQPQAMKKRKQEFLDTDPDDYVN